MKNLESQITIGELKKLLDIYPDEHGVYFGGLDFVKLDDHDTNLVSFIWGRRHVYQDQEGNVVAGNG